MSAVLLLIALAAFPLLPVWVQPLRTLVIVGLAGISLVSALRSWSVGRMLEKQTGINSLRELPWKRFEDLIAEAYRRQGYKVEENLGGGADGGVDLRLGRDGALTLVQCKQWPSGRPVSMEKVRELYGVMHAENASAAKFVATTTFTSEAVSFAQDKPIELIDGSQLVVLLRDVQTSAKIASPDSAETQEVTPDCPRCGGPMVIKVAKKGRFEGKEFWACPAFPKCWGKQAL